MTYHPKTKTFDMTEDEYQSYDEDLMGLCITCGEERSSCEPDARNYECEACGEKTVFGVAELLLMGAIELVDDDGEEGDEDESE